MSDTLIIKYSTEYVSVVLTSPTLVKISNIVLEEDQTYRILFDYNKCVQIISLEFGVLQNDSEEFLKSIDGKIVPMVYKGKSRNDNMDIFLISPIQINREIKLDMIL